jgi:hypothetical protein
MASAPMKKIRTKGHDEKYEPHGQGCVISALRKLEQVTETSSRCNKLPNNGTRKDKPTATLRLPSIQA